jgi:hypothetical protein
MAYIGQSPSVGNFQVCDAISVVNGQAAYTMQVSSVNVVPETANHMLVSLNGILQRPGSSYTVAGSTITFASNLVTGDVINFIHILGSVLDLGVPSDSTVSLAKLTATGTKDATTFLRGDNTFAAAGGGLVFLNSQTASSSASVAFSSTYITSTYEVYKIFATDIIGASDNVNFRVHYSDDNGSNYDKTFRMAVIGLGDAGGGTPVYNQETSGSGSTTMNASSPGNATAEQNNFEFTLYKPSGGFGYAHYIMALGAANDRMNIQTGALRVGESDAINNIKFDFASGAIASGTFRLYGIVNS